MEDVLSRKTADVMVYHGFNFLKENYPNELLNIDIETLKLISRTACVLGQAFGLYDTGRDKLGLTDDEAEFYGFYLTADNYLQVDRSYSVLTEAWIDYLKENLKSVKCPHCGEKVLV